MPVQARDRQCPAPSAKLNNDIYQMYLQELEERFASVGLLGGLYGMRSFQLDVELSEHICPV